MNTVQDKRVAEWTAEAVQRFWAWRAVTPYIQERYFSYQVGRGIVEFLQLTGRLSGKVLDYGCGPGYLVRHLLEKGLECYGADGAPEALARVNDTFQREPQWKGAVLAQGGPLPYPEEGFDVVLCVEVLEHLPDDALVASIMDIKRLLRPGGIVMCTTPHNERLERNMTYCPFCMTEFHSAQHLRSFDTPSLRGLLESHGLQVLFCRNIDFGEFQMTDPRASKQAATSDQLKMWRVHQRDRWLDKIFPRPFPRQRLIQHAWAGPHLCAVAVKTESCTSPSVS